MTEFHDRRSLRLADFLGAVLRRSALNGWDDFGCRPFVRCVECPGVMDGIDSHAIGWVWDRWYRIEIWRRFYPAGRADERAYRLRQAERARAYRARTP